MREKNTRSTGRSAETAEQRANVLEVWDQIRRTGEESMERGTIEQTLLQEQCVEAEKTVSTALGLSKIVA